MPWCLVWGRRAAGVCGSALRWGIGLHPYHLCPHAPAALSPPPPPPPRSQPLSLSLPAAHSPTLLHRLPPAHPLPADEVYAQKMKYKAISEELDNALNDITSL